MNAARERERLAQGQGAEAEVLAWLVRAMAEDRYQQLKGTPMWRRAAASWRSGASGRGRCSCSTMHLGVTGHPRAMIDAKLGGPLSRIYDRFVGLASYLH